MAFSGLLAALMPVVLDEEADVEGNEEEAEMDPEKRADRTAAVFRG